MGFGDKFKEMRDKAQATVAEHKEQITETVENVAAAADEKTGHKHTGQIQKLGEKATSMVDKVGGPDAGAEAGTAPAPADTEPAPAASEPAPAATDAPQDKSPTFGEPPSFDE
jgi:hypothetical protein